MTLDEKIAIAKERIIESMDIFDSNRENIYVAHSGGKDSVVIHDLAKKAFNHQYMTVVHTPKVHGFNKVHPDTIDFIYETAEEHNMHMVRGDCMKKFLMLNELWVQIDGTRRDEADRTDRSSNVVVDGQDVSRSDMHWHTDNGLFGQACVFPIFDWSDDDVWTYIRRFDLKVSQEYNSSATR